MTNPGVSQPLWAADEEILATNLNLRERTYGAMPIVDTVGVSDLAPTITVEPDESLYGIGVYGTGIVYGGA